jgi:hypothetical protein
MRTAWKLLAGFLMVCLFAGMFAWFILLGTICSEPNAPIAATGNTIQYNCHGHMVYITPLQDGLLHWLIPAMLVAGLLWKLVKKRA